MSVTGQFNYVGGQTRYGHFEDFIGLGADSGAFSGGYTGVTENSGTAAVAASGLDGLFTLTTGTSSGNRSMVVSGLNYRASDNGLVMEAGVSITSLASCAVFVGWTDTTSIEMPFTVSGTTITSNATDAVGLLFDSAATASTSWLALGVKNDSDTALTTVNSAFSPTAGATNFQNIRVQIDTNGFAYFFINGNQVAVQNLNTSTGQTGLANAVTTTAALTPVVCIRTGANAAKTATVDYMYAQKGRKY